MFKAHDIRVKVEQLTEEAMIKLCNAVTLYIKESLCCRSVVICRDARLVAPLLAQRLCNNLTVCGIDVYLNPLPVSTCQFYYSCIRHPKSAGLMITASHNPGNYIGIKIVGPGVEPVSFYGGPGGGIARIKENYDNNLIPSKDKTGHCFVINYLNEYVDYIMKLAKVEEGSLKEMKFLMEFFGGSAGTELTYAFQKAGADVVCRNIIPDGYFRQGDPNPIIESSIAPTRAAIQSGNFDFGFCFDGDGDRMDLMFKDGSQVIPCLNMSLIAPVLMSIYGGEKRCVYLDVKANPIAISRLEKAGCEVHTIMNGHSFIKTKLKENPQFFGAVEESAHYYLNLPYDLEDYSKGFVQSESSLFFALVSAKIMKENPAVYQDIFEVQKSIFRAREWALRFDGNFQKKVELLDKIASRMKELGALIIDTMDDGSPLEATIMRFNLPVKITDRTDLKAKPWTQIAQRISASEDGIIRWEICSSSQKECSRLYNEIKRITDSFTANPVS